MVVQKRRNPSTSSSSNVTGRIYFMFPGTAICIGEKRARGNQSQHLLIISVDHLLQKIAGRLIFSNMLSGKDWMHSQWHLLQLQFQAYVMLPSIFETFVIRGRTHCLGSFVCSATSLKCLIVRHAALKEFVRRAHNAWWAINTFCFSQCSL
jgi:hypothetical protein